MRSFTQLTSHAAPLPAADVDTDIIFPARFLLITSKTGLGRYAFYEWRYGPDGSERPDFVLNLAPFRGAEILVAGDNFGCGSSREQAPWALLDLGVRCIISSSFGEIFQSNCFKNGLLPVVVPSAQLAALMADAQARLSLTVDLDAQVLRRPGGETLTFDVEAWRRDALLNGLDEIDLVLNHDGPAITAFETHQRTVQPWLYAAG